MSMLSPKISIDKDENVSFEPAIPLIFSDENDEVLSFDSPDPEDPEESNEKEQV